MRIADVHAGLRKRWDGYMWNDRWLGREHAPLRCKIGQHTPIKMIDQLDLIEFSIPDGLSGRIVRSHYECRVCGRPCPPPKSSFTGLRSAMKRAMSLVTSLWNGMAHSRSRSRPIIKRQRWTRTRFARSSMTSALVSTPAVGERCNGNDHVIPHRGCILRG